MEGVSCPRCGFAQAQDSSACLSCRVAPPPYDGALSWATYHGPVRELVQLLKFQGVRPVAAFFASALAQLPLPTADVIVPMPLGPQRLRQRGFNQSQEIARHLGRARALPVAATWLRRKRDTQAQAGLSQEQRISNMRGAFALVERHGVRGRRILLLDDVLTTGATARSAATVLARAGAVSVHVITVARADRIGLSTPPRSSSGKEAAA